MSRTNRTYSALSALLLAESLIMLRFWPRYPAVGDGANYCYGALVSNVAHPPGSIGYCILGRILNSLFHNIQATFVATGFVVAVLTTVLIYKLARVLRLTPTQAWLAGALYGLSINTLVSGLEIGPYSLEALFVTLFALYAQSGLRSEFPNAYAFAATFVFGIAGMFRPTTTILLVPLWLYWLFKWIAIRTRYKTTLFACHCVVAAVIVWAWQAADQHFMTLAGYGNRTYELQALMPSQYEYATFSSAPKLGPVHLTYHLPFIELIAWGEAHTGIHVLPKIQGTPAPSLRRALTLAVIQAVKQSWWLLLSAPIMVALPFLWLRRPWRPHASFTSQERLFLSLWIGSPALFFVVGHMGQLAYLQVYLPALCVWLSACLLKNPEIKATEAKEPSPPWLPFAAALVSIAGNATFFLAAKPIGAAVGFRRALDVVALDYSGKAIREGLMSPRMKGDTGQSLRDNPIARCRTDKELLDAMRASKFSPAPGIARQANQP